MGSRVAAHSSGAHPQRLWCVGLAALQHVGSSRMRDWTIVPCIGRWILNHWTCREVLVNPFLDYEKLNTSSSMLFLFFCFCCFVFCWFLGMLRGMQDLIFQPGNLCPLKWKHRVLNTGPSERSLKSVLFWVVSVFMPLISLFFSNVYSVINSIQYIFHLVFISRSLI